jgi:GNAT superfamily N-acetyltransferase
MSATIRPAREADVELLMQAYEWLFAPPGYTPKWWDPQRAAGALREAIADERSNVLVADEGGELVGLCSAYLELNSVRFGQRCWVEDLAVDPGRRSQGIGGQLLDAAADWARERGATHIELDTGLAREGAQRFYDRRAPTSKGYSYSWAL